MSQTINVKLTPKEAILLRDCVYARVIERNDLVNNPEAKRYHAMYRMEIRRYNKIYDKLFVELRRSKK